MIIVHKWLVCLGSTTKRMLLTEAIEIESQSNEFQKLEPFKMVGEELIEYLPYIYQPKMNSENEQSSHQVKTPGFVLEHKHECQIKRKTFFNSSFVTCFHHFLSEALPALPNIVWKRWQSF